MATSGRRVSVRSFAVVTQFNGLVIRVNSAFVIAHLLTDCAQSDVGRGPLGIDFSRPAVVVKRVVELPCELVLACFGLHPKLGPIAGWGLALEKKALKVDTEKFQTSEPGIFAVGDVNTYPGKKKLILSGFHEAALAAFGVQHHLYPEKRQFLQYTTTSPIMRERLGVAPPE